MNEVETGAPYVPGGTVELEASGAFDAGFEEFSVEFLATTIVDAQLDSISLAEAYGDGQIAVQWTPGTDEITVTVSVSGAGGRVGSLLCEADDPSGSFNVSRDAIRAAVDDQDVVGLSLQVTRRRSEQVMGLSTVGDLLYAEVQPTGWLDLVSSSSEFRTLENCDLEVCGDEQCVDLLSDEQHCGACGEACSAGGTCTSGVCLAPEDSNAACSDGLDNDGDGYVDCDDFDCSMDALVTECCQDGQEVCPTHLGTPVCTWMSTNTNCGSCGNTCGVFFECEPHVSLPGDFVCATGENTDTECHDGLDNDNDGFVDCDDSYCEMFWC
ncbi:MAG: hypothetical protein ACRBN8_32790 [Nannocystales bacterium]